MPRFKVGDRVNTTNCGVCEIVHVENAHNITVKFLNTGTILKTEHSCLHSGTLRDYNQPTLFGVGIVGEDFRRNFYSHPKIKSCWSDMLRRCYDTQYTHYTGYGGSGVTVCGSWKQFGNFKSWFDENYVEGYELDKDLLSNKNKVYSPETCIFLPKQVNQYLRGCKFHNKNLPAGVSVNSKDSSKFCAYIMYSVAKKRTNLGSTYRTSERAAKVYLNRKLEDMNITCNHWLKEGIISDEIFKLLVDFRDRYELKYKELHFS